MRRAQIESAIVKSRFRQCAEPFRFHHKYLFAIQFRCGYVLFCEQIIFRCILAGWKCGLILKFLLCHFVVPLLFSFVRLLGGVFLYSSLRNRRSSLFSCNWRRAKKIRLLTVPTGRPNFSAISVYLFPSKNIRNGTRFSSFSSSI